MREIRVSIPAVTAEAFNEAEEDRWEAQVKAQHDALTAMMMIPTMRAAEMVQTVGSMKRHVIIQPEKAGDIISHVDITAPAWRISHFWEKDGVLSATMHSAGKSIRELAADYTPNDEQVFVVMCD